MTLTSTLTSICGHRYVLTDPEAMTAYGRDEYPRVFSLPRAVALPASTEEVVALMRACHEQKVPVTPRGRGTGLSGGAVPLHDSVVISLERMERVLEVDVENQMVTVEPGLILKSLHDAVEGHGLFYPPDPASLENCSIGGTVAENAGGPRALKYGVTRHYVSALEVVLPDGRQVRYGGKYLKNTMGYDLPHVFIGSEGTLGIFTSITLRLIPLPPARQDLFIPFPTLEQASLAVTRILNGLRVTPAVLEFMDAASVRLVEKATGKELPHSGAGGHLLVQLDGSSPEAVEDLTVRVGELCAELGAEDVLVATSNAMRERLWHARRVLPEACKTLSGGVEAHDLTVPRSSIPRLVAAMHRLAEGYGLEVACFGHAGDGNIHVNLMGQDAVRFSSILPEVNKDVVSTTLELGGSISGEHGTGCVKKPYLSRTLGQTELALMRAIKQAIDPANLMNPGKIF